MTLSLTSQRVLRDVDLVARAGLDLDTFLTEVLTSIARVVPHVGTCVATVDPSTLLLTSTHKFGDLKGRDERDHEFGIIEYGDPEASSFVELAHRAVPAIAIHAQDPSSFRVNEFMRPLFGYNDELRVILRDSGQVWGAVALFRQTEDPYFDDDDVELMAALSEPFSIGLRSGLLTSVTTAGPAAAVGPAVIIVGGDDRILQMSAGAEQRLRDLMTGEDGTAPDGIVGSLVGGARRFAAGQAAHPPRCRIRGRSGMWLVLHATPLTARDGSSGSEVVVTIDEARPPEIVPLVVAAFGLTQRERDVTQYVLQGMDTKEIAASMHLSTYTVQDHLKSVFNKAEVRSRRELIARIYFDQYVPRMGTEVGPTGWFAATE